MPLLVMFDDFQQNFENYMSWEILAAANGNEFAIEKMQFFLDAVLSTQAYIGSATVNIADMAVGHIMCKSESY